MTLSRRELFGAVAPTAAKTEGNEPRKPKKSSISSLSSTTFDGFINDEGGIVFNVTNPAYGAKGDTVVFYAGGSIAALSTTFTQSQVTFTAADAGKVITVQGAGLNAEVLTTRITAVTGPTTAVLAHPALTAVTNAGFSCGTDDSAAILTALSAAGQTGTVYAPAGIYTIFGSHNGDANGGNQLHFRTKGGLVGQGGKYVPGQAGSRPNTVFLCADATAGIFAQAHARYEGFTVDGNGIATVPLRTGAVNYYRPEQLSALPTGGFSGDLPAGTISSDGVSYGTFIDVWATRSAGNGITCLGSQNLSFYDCGATDNALDGLYMDGGTGGLDYFNFYERGSLRYGIHADHLFPTWAGFTYVTGDVNFYAGTLDTHPDRRGVSKIYNRAGLAYGWYDMHIVGTNLTGPTVDLDQKLGHTNHMSRCVIWATPTGANPGNACIQIGGTAPDHRKFHFLKIDGCAFMSGDSSVYITDNNGYYLYPSSGWVCDDTTYGPVSAGYVEMDRSLMHLTIPAADCLLAGRTGSWRQAQLAAGWTGTINYRVMGEGWVQLKGSAETATGAAGTIFNLPLGYRHRGGAPFVLQVACVDSAATSHALGMVTVHNSDGAGEVAFAPLTGTGTIGPGTRVHLDGVRFPVRGHHSGNEANW